MFSHKILETRDSLEQNKRTGEAKNKQYNMHIIYCMLSSFLRAVVDFYDGTYFRYLDTYSVAVLTILNPK